MATASTTHVYLPGRSVRTATGVRARAFVIYGLYLASYFWWIRYVPGDQRLLAGIAFVCVPLIYGQVHKRILGAYNRDVAVALATLHQGNATRAERDLETLQARYRWPRFLGRLTAYNRALAVMRQGRLDDAIAMLVDADRRGGAIGMDGAIASTLGYLHALRGDVELAGTWLAEGKRRDLGLTHATPFPHILSEIAIDLRASRFREVQARLDRDWAEMESSMKGERLRPLRLLRAFAAAQTTDVRDSGTIAPLIAGLHGVHADELAYLGAAWPALDAFIRAHLPA
jgi:hypothetical protein